VGGKKVPQALQLQTGGQDWDQVTCSEVNHEVAGDQVLQTKVLESTYWSLPIMVQPPSERQMLVVLWWRRQEGGPAAGTPLLPLLPVERPRRDNMESGGKSNVLRSGQMQEHADL
jgi:hypothetical protein